MMLHRLLRHLRRRRTSGAIDAAGREGRELNAKYPHWMIVVNPTAGYWAAAREDQTPATPGCETFLDAETVDELTRQLDEQERLRGREPRPS